MGRATDTACTPGAPAATGQTGSATQLMAQLVVVVSVPAVLPNLAMTNVAQVGMSADEVLRRAVEHVATVAGHRLVLHSVELLKQEETPVAVTLPPRLA